MLKLFDRAGVFLLLFEELLPLGPQEFILLLEALPLPALGAKIGDFLSKFEEGGG
jgi:hypothetical protein